MQTVRSAVNAPVLVLNASFEAIAICRARRALVLVVKERAVVQEDLGFEAHEGIMMPTVIRLKEYRRIPHLVKVLSPRNVKTRDGNQCQYCGVVRPSYELTLDHVVPKAQGGPSTWENLVAACNECNRRKGNQTPEQAGMPLKRRPRLATLHTARGILRAEGEAEATWKRYLFYDNAGERGLSVVGVA